MEVAVKSTFSNVLSPSRFHSAQVCCAKSLVVAGPNHWSIAGCYPDWQLGLDRLGSGPGVPSAAQRPGTSMGLEGGTPRAVGQVSRRAVQDASWSQGERDSGATGGHQGVVASCHKGPCSAGCRGAGQSHPITPRPTPCPVQCPARWWCTTCRVNVNCVNCILLEGACDVRFSFDIVWWT